MGASHPRATILSVAILGLAAGACSLFVSLDDLQDGGASCGADCDAGVDGDARTEDAIVDSPNVVIDASDGSTFDPVNGCPAAHGSKMVRIGDYCIDQTEVTTDDYYAFSDAVTAGSISIDAPGACSFKTSYAPIFDDAVDCTTTTLDRANGSLPIVCVDYCDAFAFCSWAGKRLCGVGGSAALSQSDLVDPKLSEWMNACTNGGSDTYPYGMDYIDGACNSLQADGGIDASASRKPVGSLPECVGGVPADPAGRQPFDLAGNVDEWANYCEGDAGATDICHWLGDSWSYSNGPVSTCQIQDEDVRTSHFHDLGIRCCGTPAP